MKYMIWASYPDRTERFFLYKRDSEVVLVCARFRKSRSMKSPLGWSVFRRDGGEYVRLTDAEMTAKRFWV